VRVGGDSRYIRILRMTEQEQKNERREQNLMHYDLWPSASALLWEGTDGYEETDDNNVNIIRLHKKGELIILPEAHVEGLG